MLGSSFEETSVAGSSDDEWVSDLRERADADFSLGKRYCDYYLFKNIVKESSGNEPTAMLESLLHERLQNLQLEQNIKFLQDQLPQQFWRDTHTKFEDLMILTGRVQRMGNAQNKDHIRKILTRTGDAPPFGVRPGVSISPEPPTQSPTPSPKVASPSMTKVTARSYQVLAPQRLTNRGSASPMHVIKLKEYGDAIGESPKYDHFTVTGSPPTTHMTVHFGGHRLETIGRSIKDAKQQLAMLLCAELDLHVP